MFLLLPKIIMTKIFFSNTQFKKLVEIAYLWSYMKSANYVETEVEYDAEAYAVLDYLAIFAKEHGMWEYLVSKDEWWGKLDELCLPAIDAYNENL